MNRCLMVTKVNVIVSLPIDKGWQNGRTAEWAKEAEEAEEAKEAKKAQEAQEA